MIFWYVREILGKRAFPLHIREQPRKGPSGIGLKFQKNELGLSIKNFTKLNMW